MWVGMYITSVVPEATQTVEQESTKYSEMKVCVCVYILLDFMYLGLVV